MHLILPVAALQGTREPVHTQLRVCIVLYYIVLHCLVLHCIVLYRIVSIHLYSASYSAHQSEALPVRETPREERSVERTKRGTWLTGYKV